MASEYMNNWKAQIHRGVLELCLLNVLARGPMHGYDIACVMREQPGMAPSNGTVYRLLRRLAHEQLIVFREAKSSLGPVRKRYSLTKTGQRTRVRMNGHWGMITRGVDAFARGAAT